MVETKKLLSIILLSYYSKDRIRKSYLSLRSILEKEDIPFEFIVMDDGSSDNSFLIALEMEKEFENVKAYQLSRNYGMNYSWMAGLSVCNGECAMPIPDDEQNPYQTIVEMYHLWEMGNKVIIPYREKRDDLFINRFLASLYYKIINKLSDFKFPDGGADFCFLDREVINVLVTRIHPINTTVITEVFRLGFSPYYYAFHRPPSIAEEKSRWTLSKKLKLAKDVFFSSSTFPIRFITLLGFWVFFLSFILIVFYTGIYFFGDNEKWGLVVRGWTSIILTITLFGGLTIFCLGIIAEYIWRIYEEVKNRPGYIIKKR